MGGEVKQPGLVPLRSRLSSLKAVLAAGGFRDTAQLTHVVVLRDAGGHPAIFELDVKKILAGEESDLLLRPYDVVYVPKSKIARANLFVEQYIKRVIPLNLQGAAQYNFLGGDS